MGNVLKRGAMIILLAVISINSTGCAALGISLFTSDHTHYHYSEETKKKVRGMEDRVKELERRRGITTPGTTETPGEELHIKVQ